jgi:hypothetical protein
MTYREELKINMAQAGITYQQMAVKIGMKPYKLYYKLNTASDARDIDMRTYILITSQLEKMGLDASATDGDNLQAETFHANSIFGNALKILNDEVSNDLADGKLSSIEQNRLISKLAEIKKEIVTEIDSLIAITKSELKKRE